nr:ribonucleoside-diphosphate reductase subunit alpha [Gammaproteobacteria bacterium]
MQFEPSTAPRTDTRPNGKPGVATEIAAAAPGRYRVIRRNGKATVFDKNKIKHAVTKAFLAVEDGNAAASGRIREAVDRLTERVTGALVRNLPDGGIFHIEDIQDQVELALMRGEHHKVARAYVLYREEHARARAAHKGTARIANAQPVLNVTLPDGNIKPLDTERLHKVVNEACRGTADVDPEPIIAETVRNLYDGVHEHEVGTALTLAARTLIEKEPN